ncbi:MAG TPA: insulinase family protein [Bacteroidetes bacterium]|nr:insulinase family protein [Bacteroidota bacterium]
MVNDNTIYQRTLLENGLRVVTERMPNVRSAALGIWVEAGSRDEDASVNGVSHFLEHMLFKGTEHRTAKQIAEALESVGGSLNAFTGKELSCYSAHVLDEDLALAVNVVSDLLLHPAFDPAEIEKEKQVILQEISQYRETPEEVIFERFYRAVFDDHPLAQEIHGTEENVLKFTRQGLVDHMRQHYTAARTVVAVAGNVKHEAVVELVQQHLADAAQGEKRVLKPVPPFQPVQIREKHSNCQQAHICVGGRGLAYDDPRKFPLLVLDTLLGGGMSSRLFQNIRENLGLAYSVYSFLDFLADTGVYGVYAATEAGSADRTEELIREELAGLARGNVKLEEVERTKRQLKGSMLLGLEGTGSRMNRLARLEIYLGRHYTLDEVAEAIDSVTRDEVVQVAQQIYRPENIASVMLLPA